MLACSAADHSKRSERQRLDHVTAVKEKRFVGIQRKLSLRSDESLRRSADIKGGTLYLKDLFKMFNGRVDLALTGYNAGEGRL